MTSTVPSAWLATRMAVAARRIRVGFPARSSSSNRILPPRMPANPLPSMELGDELLEHVPHDAVVAAGKRGHRRKDIGELARSASPVAGARKTDLRRALCRDDVASEPARSPSQDGVRVPGHGGVELELPHQELLVGHRVEPPWQIVSLVDLRVRTPAQEIVPQRLGPGCLLESRTEGVAHQAERPVRLGKVEAVARELIRPELEIVVVARHLEGRDAFRPGLMLEGIGAGGQPDLPPVLADPAGPRPGPEIVGALRSDEMDAVHFELVALRLAACHRMIVEHQALATALLLEEPGGAESRKPAPDHDQVVAFRRVRGTAPGVGQFAVAEIVRDGERLPGIAVRARVVTDASVSLPIGIRC